MADDHSVVDFYECPFCDKLTKHVPASAEEFGGDLVPKTDGVFKPRKCCECGSVCMRRTDGKVSDQPGGNGCYIKYL